MELFWLFCEGNRLIGSYGTIRHLCFSFRKLVDKWDCRFGSDVMCEFFGTSLWFIVCLTYSIALLFSNMCWVSKSKGRFQVVLCCLKIPFSYCRSHKYCSSVFAVLSGSSNCLCSWCYLSYLFFNLISSYCYCFWHQIV